MHTDTFQLHSEPGTNSFFVSGVKIFKLCKVVSRSVISWEERYVCLILFRVNGFEPKLGFKMSSLSWRRVFCCALFSLVIILGRLTGKRSIVNKMFSLILSIYQQCREMPDFWHFLHDCLDAMLEGSSMGYLSQPHFQEPTAFPQIIRVSDVKASHDGQKVTFRKKRNIFYQGGLRLCGQDTAEDIVANHLGYFHLRGKMQPRQQGGNPVLLCCGLMLKSDLFRYTLRKSAVISQSHFNQI